MLRRTRKPSGHVRGLLSRAIDAHAQAILDDYTGILQIARNYNQQQQRLRFLQEEDALAQDEQMEPLNPSPIHEHVRGFLDYLSVLKTLRQDGGSRHVDT